MITLDNRDVGLSQRFDDAVPEPYPPKEGVCAYTLDDMADDAVGVLDHYGIDRAHIVGASMGGLIAQIIACRQPARCRSLVLIMTAASINDAVGHTASADGGAFLTSLWHAIEPGPQRGVSLAQFIEDRAPYWALLNTDAAYPHMSQEASVAVQEIDIIDFLRGGVDWQRTGADRQTLAINEWERRHGDAHTRELARVTAPALVLHGRHDPLVGVAAGRSLAQQLPSSRFLEYLGGHNFGNHPTVTRLLLAAMVEHMHAH